MNGQQLLAAWVAWISSWVVLADEGQAWVLALWAMHTWFAPKYPATAYVHVTSDGPGCGKTTLMEVLGALSLRPRMRATLRALSVVRDIAECDHGVTYFFDQVEALNASKISDEQAILLTGYRMGGEHGISVGQKQVSFSTYCAKLFACIGGIAPDLRSRSLIIRLAFGTPARVWSDEVLTRAGEAERLVGLGAVFFNSTIGKGNAPRWTPPEGMSGREREIYTPLWSVACALGLDAATMAKIRAAFTDLSFYKKTVEQKSYRELRADTDDAAAEADREFATLALRHMASVMPARTEGRTGDLSTERILEAMRAIPEGPWRVFRGKPLDGVGLAGLVGRFFGGPDSVAVIRMQSGRGAKTFKGYRRVKVLEALAKLERGE